MESGLSGERRSEAGPRQTFDKSASLPDFQRLTFVPLAGGFNGVFVVSTELFHYPENMTLRVQGVDAVIEHTRSPLMVRSRSLFANFFEAPRVYAAPPRIPAGKDRCEIRHSLI